MEGTIPALYLYMQLKNTLKDTNFASFATQSFATFLITSFSQSSTSTVPKITSALSTNYSDFVLRASSLPLYNSQNSPQPVLNGVLQALMGNSALFKSAVWSFMTSAPQNATDTLIQQITVQALRWQVQVSGIDAVY